MSTSNVAWSFQTKCSYFFLSFLMCLLMFILVVVVLIRVESKRKFSTRNHCVYRIPNEFDVIIIMMTTLVVRLLNWLVLEFWISMLFCFAPILCNIGRTICNFLLKSENLSHLTHSLQKGKTKSRAYAFLWASINGISCFNCFNTKTRARTNLFMRNDFHRRWNVVGVRYYCCCWSIGLFSSLVHTLNK